MTLHLTAAEEQALDIPAFLDKRPDDVQAKDVAHRETRNHPDEAAATTDTPMSSTAQSIALVPGPEPGESEARAGWAVRIAGTWRRSVVALLDTGRVLQQAKAALPHGSFAAMIAADLPFGARTAERLIAIAADARLANPTHVSHLPASWGTLYELTKLDDASFERALGAGRIRPDMERAEAVKLNARHQRQIAGVGTDAEQRSADDFYPTPPEAVERLLAVESFDGPIWEPACGDGAIAKVLIDAGYAVTASDLVDRGYGEAARDFLTTAQVPCPNIVTNPPFALLDQFLSRAADVATGKVAMIARLQALEGKTRGELFRSRPPARVWIFSARLPFKRPGWADTGNGSMMAYLWLVWDRAHVGPTSLGWL